MTDPENKPTELGPIARELMVLVDELRVLAETSIDPLPNVTHDGATPVGEQIDELA